MDDARWLAVVKVLTTKPFFPLRSICSNCWAKLLCWMPTAYYCISDELCLVWAVVVRLFENPTELDRIWLFSSLWVTFGLLREPPSIVLALLSMWWVTTFLRLPFPVLLVSVTWCWDVLTTEYLLN